MKKIVLITGFYLLICNQNLVSNNDTVNEKEKISTLTTLRLVAQLVGGSIFFTESIQSFQDLINKINNLKPEGSIWGKPFDQAIVLITGVWTFFTGLIGYELLKEPVQTALE